MKSLNRPDMRWRIIVTVLVLLAACRFETTPTIVPSSTDSIPAFTAEALTTTAPTAITPSITVEDCARGDHFDQIESGGQARQYLLHVPAMYDPEGPAALVLVFHRAGIGAQRFVDYSRFSNVSDREGFLIVYPQGLGDQPVWNPAPGSKDVQFVRDLIDHLQRRCRVDPNRIYASGHSNGGGMADRLACELADRIAAIGTISGAYARSAQCSPSGPIPVFAIHDTADPIVPYEGIPEWASLWAKRNGCDAQPTDIPHNVLIHEQRWTNCRAGAEVILYTIEDLGHDWSHDLIDMAQTIWDFFEQHPLDNNP